MATLFEHAVAQSGPSYLDAEAQLLAAGDAARPTLNGALSLADPVARLLAGCLLAWLGGEGATFKAALNSIDAMADSVARTPIGKPMPTHVANMLTARYQARLVDLLALRVLKQPEWPHWKRLGALLYLRQHVRPGITEALLRIAASTGDAVAQQTALEAIVAANDPQLQPKLHATQAWLQPQGLALPAPVQRLLDPP